MSSIVWNGIAMLAAKLLPPVFAFTIHATVARVAGVRTLGEYVYLLAVLMIFQAISGSGMQYLVTRELAAYPKDAIEYLRKARTFALCSGIASTLGYLAYVQLALPRGLRLPAVLLSATLLPSGWIAVQESVFTATRTHHRITIVAILENISKASVAVGALLLGHGLIAVCAGVAIARIVALAAGGVMVRYAGFPGTWRFAWPALPQFVLAVAPFAGLYVVSIAYFRIDVPIVQALLGESSTGFYGAAATLFAAVLLLPESALSAAYPRLAMRFHVSNDGYGGATLLLAKLLALAVVPVSLGLICLADPIVSLAYGHRFPASAPVLRLLALSLPVHAVNGALGQALQAAHQQRAMLGIVAAGLIAHITLCITLVSAVGIQGAAIAMLCSSLCVALGALWTVHRRIAPIAFRVRHLQGALPIVGPIVLTFVTPAPFRILAGGVGVLWLVAGAVWHGTIARTELVEVVQALRPRRLGAVA